MRAQRRLGLRKLTALGIATIIISTETNPVVTRAKPQAVDPVHPGLR